MAYTVTREHHRQGYDVPTMYNTCLVPLCGTRRDNSTYTCFEWHKLRTVSDVTNRTVQTFLQRRDLDAIRRTSRPVDSADRTAVISERSRRSKIARRTLSPVRPFNLQDSE